MSAPATLIGVGDSITYSAYPPAERFFWQAAGLDVERALYTPSGPRYFMPHVTGTTVWLNLANGGWRVSDLDTQGTIVDSYLNADYNCRVGGIGGAGLRRPRMMVLVAMIGTNPSFANPVTQAAATATYLDARVAAGWTGNNKIMLGTIISRGDGIQPNFDLSYAAPLNAIIRDPAWMAAHGVTIINDFGALPEFIPNTTSCNNTLYYDVDKVHPTMLGASVMADLFTANLATLIG